jgi:hypothetical protein
MEPFYRYVRDFEIKFSGNCKEVWRKYEKLARRRPNNEGNVFIPRGFA